MAKQDTQLAVKYKTMDRIKIANELVKMARSLVARPVTAGLKDLYSRFEDVQSSLRNWGASDTEPRVRMVYLMEDAFKGKPWKTPTATSWELYSSVPGWKGAARKLASAAKKVYNAIQKSSADEIIEFAEYHGFQHDKWDIKEWAPEKGTRPQKKKPSKSESSIVTALRRGLNVDPSDKMVFGRQLTFEDSRSHKFHYFAIFEIDPVTDVHIAGSAYGRIGGNPKVIEVASGPLSYVDGKLAKKIKDKLRKGYR